MSIFGRKTSGVFVPSEKGGYREATDVPDNASLNELMWHFGYDTSQIEIIFTTDRKSTVSNIAMEVFTRNIVFMLTDKKATFISERDVKKVMGDFSVTKHYESMKIKDVLEAGIEAESMSVEFLSKVLNMSNLSRNGMFYSSKIKTYLYFTNGLLTNFQYDDGFSHWAKHLQKVNKTVYDRISKGAYKYRAGNDFQLQKEVNMQCEAWGAIPAAFGNEFIPLHTYENGLVNLHMIRVTHYGYPITMKSFQELNFGRYQVISGDGTGDVVLRLNRFDYRFSKDGQLIDFQLVNYR
ncbi:hypothetical protein ACFS5N_05830 [Mucilaginibacter ximonensis]|uniref:Uncharacterized protein n=1 Tax=Mucilaginibacter ximonensis TaxID=538021 RepID=A0ABW5Y9C2_9SPHI